MHGCQRFCNMHRMKHMVCFIVFVKLLIDLPAGTSAFPYGAYVKVRVWIKSVKVRIFQAAQERRDGHHFTNMMLTRNFRHLKQFNGAPKFTQFKINQLCFFNALNLPCFPQKEANETR